MNSGITIAGSIQRAIRLRIVLLSVLFLSLSVAVFLVLPSRAFASPIGDYNNWENGHFLPNEGSQYINLSEDGGSGNFANTSGEYSYEKSGAYIKIYSRTKSLKGVSIQFADRGIGKDRACDGYQLAINEYALTEHSDGSTAVLPTDTQVVSPYPVGGNLPCNVYRDIRVNTATFVASQRPEHAGLYVGLLEIKIYGTPIGERPKAPSFILKMDNLGGTVGADAKLSIAGSDDITPDLLGSAYLHDSYVQSDDRILFRNGVSIYPSKLSPSNTIHYSFQPPCSFVAGSSFFVDIAGLDTQNYVQTQYRIPFTDTVVPSGNNLQVSLTRANGSKTGIVGGVYDAPDAPQNMYGALITHGGPGVKYVLRITGLTGGNGVRIVLPFDGASGKFSCPNSNDGRVEANCSQVRVAPGRLDSAASRYQIVAADRPITRAEAGSYPRSPWWSGTAQGAVLPNPMLGTSGHAPSNGPQWWGFDGTIGGVNRYHDGSPVYFYYVGARDSNGTTVDAGSFTGPVTVTLNENCKTWNMSALESGVEPYTELGRSSTFWHNVYNAGPHMALSGEYSGWMSSDYGLGNMYDLSRGWRVSGSATQDIPPGQARQLLVSALYVPADVGLLGAGFCQRFAVSPPQLTNGIAAGGYRESPNTCTVAVGGKTAVGTGVDRTVVEQQDTVNFSIATSTSSFHAANGYTGYTTQCRYYITTQTNNASGVSRGGDQSCDQWIAATGTLNAPVTYTVPTAPGSRVCLVARIANVTSVASPGGNGGLATEPLGTEHTSCVDVVSKPYFKVYGGDISAGNGFAGSGACINNSASIIGWNRLNDDANPANRYRGSGAQFAVYAQNAIRGVASAQGVGQAPVIPAYATAPSGLAFANTENVNLANEVFGGRYAAGSCAPDFYGSLPENTNVWQDIQSANQMAQADPSKGAFIFKSSQNTLLRGEPENSAYKIAQGTNIKLYVDGDLFVNSNITAEQGMTSVDKIPGLTVIVRGNIYISPNVTEMYGTYIAQPNANHTAGGNIYTCALAAGTTGAAVAGQDRYSLCGNRLAVTGSFVAENLHLMRTRSSMTWDRTGNAVSGDSAQNASEVFYYNPLFWLRQSISTTTESETEVIYDAITTLPPVL